MRATLELEGMSVALVMIPSLATFGMEIAFDCDPPVMADFTRIHTPSEPCITEVKHKTYVDVNEEGTEARRNVGRRRGGATARVARGIPSRTLAGGYMHRATFTSLALFVAPLALAAQQSTAAPHDTVRGAIRAVDVRARTVEVTSGVGFALSLVRLQVPATVPITDREGAQPEPIGLAALQPGDVIRATFGSRATGFVAYTIERVGRMAP